MRLGKRPTTFEGKPPLKLASHAGYRQAAQKLDELKNQLPSHKTERDKLELRLLRASSQARQFADRCAPLPNMADQDLDSIARDVIAAGMVHKELLLELRSKVPPPRPPIEDTYDAGTVTALNDERGTIELLQRAIGLQERELQTQKRLAMQHLNATLKPERRALISKLADALIQLSNALVEEKAFDEWLASADPDLIANVRPRLFPILLLQNPEVSHWLTESAEDNMLTPEQIEAIEATGLEARLAPIGA